MSGRAVRAALIVAFAVVVGHLAWNVFAAPPIPEYFVHGEGTLLAGNDPAAKNLYLRRTLFLPQRPRHAWFQAIGRDDLRLYVNGRLVQGSKLEGFPVAVLADLTPYLRLGRNAIALATRQSSLRHPPAVAVNGGYALSDGEHPIGPDSRWRCSDKFERTAHWWFDPGFRDENWVVASSIPGQLRGRVRQPPRSITSPPRGQWIMPAGLQDDRAALRRTFDVSGGASQCWLRVTAIGAYRLAVNGVLIDEQEDQLGAMVTAPPAQRTYDLMPLVQRGRNVVALVLTRVADAPRLLADLEVEDRAGVRAIATDEHWQSHSGAPPDWMQEVISQADGWEPCLVEPGDLGVEPWYVRRDAVRLTLPLAVIARQIAQEIALILAVALLTAFACRHAARAIARRQGALVRYDWVCLALLLPTVALAGAMLAVYDPQIARQDVYRFSWLALAVAAVPFQWCLLALLPTTPRGTVVELQPETRRPRHVWAAAIFVFALMTGGFALRARGIESESLHWDEVENLEAVRGIFARGFPSRQVHPDMPIAYVHTSELFFFGPAAVSLFTNDDHAIIRLPGVLFSTLTVGLLYLMGRHIFGSSVGLIAATLLALSPLCIAMSSFGRYFAQLQFFAVLTVYAFWMCLRGGGLLPRRWVWLTALSFIAMFLTWEAAALMAPGMMLAAVLVRRGRLRTIFGSGTVWAGLLVVALVIVLQFSHVTLQQTQFLWYGTSHSDVSLKPMWRYPFFQPWYYLWQSGWSQDGLMPMLGVAAAALLAIRHPWRRQVRFLLIIHMGTCLFMALTLTATAWRYIHHQIPFVILLASAALVAGAHALARLVRQPGVPALARSYAGAVVVGVVVVLIALGSGQTVDLPELSSLRVEGYNPAIFRFPDLQGPANYVCANWRDGDVLLATDPFQVDYLTARAGRPECKAGYWPASNLRHPATLDNRRSLPLDRRDGTPMIPDPETLREVFNRNDRVWYIVQPIRHWDQNVAEMTSYLLQHMDVVYEDFDALVLLRDNHRPADLRRRNDEQLERAQARYLP